MPTGRVPLALRAAVGIVALLVVPPTGKAEVHLPQPAVYEQIIVRADASSQWTEGAYDVRRLQGHVSISQGGLTARGDDAMVWVLHAESLGAATKIIAYLEGAGGRPTVVTWSKPRVGEPGVGNPSPGDSSANAATLSGQSKAEPSAREEAANWFGRFWTTGSIDWRTPKPTPPPAEPPAIHSRGSARLAAGSDEDAQAAASNPVVQAAVGATGTPPDTGGVQPAQFQGFAAEGFPPFQTPLVAPPAAATPSGSGFRSVQINPRSGVGGSAEYRPQEGVGVITGGVNIIVEGIQADGMPMGVGLGAGGQIDKIDLETDRAVVWTAPGAGVSGSFQQTNETPLEIYMEGNIVFRQGDRTVYADRMYYDVRRRVGVILNAELLTPLPEVEGTQYEGLVRLKAGVIRQLDDARFVATDALVTTSRIEEPTYNLRSDTITFLDNRQPVVDPATGIVTFESEKLARSQNNFIEFGGVPLLYWPTITTNLEEPTFYINDLRIRNDDIFGTQILPDFDVYEVFGLEEIDGTKWDLSTDYLSDRGFGVGTEFTYSRDTFGGFIGPAIGRVDA
ncbi:MAG: hypothetical protein AAGF31_09185, partial [Planctomycetota bacterium]